MCVYVAFVCVCASICVAFVVVCLTTAERIHFSIEIDAPCDSSGAKLGINVYSGPEATLNDGPIISEEAVWHPIQMTHSFLPLRSPPRPLGSHSLERHIHRSGTSLEQGRERDNV